MNINTEQFSVKFEDQPECERRSVEYRVVECKGCSAFLSSHSQIIEGEMKVERRRSAQKKEMDDAMKQEVKAGHDRKWNCEYCYTSNDVPDDYVLPDTENPCYLIEKAPVREGEPMDA